MNRFVKDNMVLFIVMGGTIIGAIVLLAFAVLGHAQMFRSHSEAEELRSQILQLIKQSPAPVAGNVAPMQEDIQFFKEKTAELLPHFGQIKGAALDAFVKELGIGGDECSEDGKYSLAATRCIGACGLAPVLTINNDVYGRLTKEDVDGILEKYL